MSWIKEANKLGKFERTYLGFRIYCTKQPFHTERIVQEESGMYRITNFIRGEYIAIDKTGMRFTGFMDDIRALIDKEDLRRRMVKKFGEELYWG